MRNLVMHVTPTITGQCSIAIFDMDDDAECLIRRDQLYHNKTKLIVDLVHVRDWNGHIADMLETKPTEYLPLVSFKMKLKY